MYLPFDDKNMNMRTPSTVIDEDESSSPNLCQLEDFSDYMWMGEIDLDVFDKQVEDELMEQYLMDEAYQAMLAEDGGRYVYDIYCCDQSVTGPPGCYALKELNDEYGLTTEHHFPVQQEHAGSLALPAPSCVVPLNPNAPEFVPLL